MNNIFMDNIFILFLCVFLIFLFLNEFFSSCNTSSPLSEYFTNDKIKVYNFNTTWCGHSIKFQPIWDAFSKSLNESDNIVAYDVKCDDNKNEKLIDRYYVEGFPTVIIDYGNKFIKYSGPRSVNGLRSVLNLELINEPNVNNNNQVKCGNRIDTRPSKVINFNQYEDVSGTTIYNFNTSWCGYSVSFQPIWDKFTESNKDNNINIVDVKCDKSENDDLCNRYPVEGFPTVLKVKDNVITPYNGPRTLEGLTEFANN
jgi:thiol-disulfide isomerase/thioredoxin